MTATITETKVDQKQQTVKFWNLVLLNDDFTPFDFVVLILMRICGKTEEEAEAIAAAVHKNDKGLVGRYTKEIAETKAHQLIQISKANNHPLKAVAEPE